MKMYYEKRLRLKSQEMFPWVCSSVIFFGFISYAPNVFTIGIFLYFFGGVIWTFFKTPKDKGF